MFDETICRLLGTNDDLALAVNGYSRFALDVLRLQARFKQEGVYEPRAYAAVSKDVYANNSYMRSCWPHHYRQAQFFRVEDMIRAGAGRFYDVGVGTGFYSRSHS